MSAPGLLLPLAVVLLLAPAGARALRSADIPGCSAEAARARLPLPHGCATALNLEAMVADPDDLDRARALPPATGEPAIAPVRRHRAGTVPEPRPPATGAPAPGGPEP